MSQLNTINAIPSPVTQSYPCEIKSLHVVSHSTISLWLHSLRCKFQFLNLVGVNGFCAQTRCNCTGICWSNSVYPIQSLCSVASLRMHAHNRHIPQWFLHVNRMAQASINKLCTSSWPSFSSNVFSWVCRSSNCFALSATCFCNSFWWLSLWSICSVLSFNSCLVSCSSICNLCT